MSKISTILVIDDEPAISDTLKAVFPEFTFLSACSAKEGLEILQDESRMIDVLLLDYKLPDRSGLEILKEIYFIYKENIFQKCSV